jgi:hypothetical protein
MHKLNIVKLLPAEKPGLITPAFVFREGAVGVVRNYKMQ